MICASVYDAYIKLALPPIKDRLAYHRLIGNLATVLGGTKGAHVVGHSSAYIDFTFKYANGARVFTTIVDTLTTDVPLYVSGKHPKPLACYLWLLLRNAGNFQSHTALNLITPYNDRPLTKEDGQLDYEHTFNVYRSLRTTAAFQLVRSLPPVTRPSSTDARQFAMRLG